MFATMKAIVESEAMSSSMAEEIMNQILLDQFLPEQLGALFMALYFRSPSSKIFTGFVKALRAADIEFKLSTDRNLIDVCGTGGDGLASFNVSTTVAFVTAAAGQKIAKHGNRAVSSQCGSFDVLEALKVSCSNNRGEVERSLSEHHLAFMFAPAFHPTLKKLSGIRKALGIRTVLNCLGPLLNPMGVRRQLIGVYARNLVLPMAQALRELGSDEVMIVHGLDGSDELSICSPTQVAYLKNGEITEKIIHPEDFGLRSGDGKLLKGGSAIENAAILKKILKNEKSLRRDLVILNSAAALLVGAKAKDMQEGIHLAKQAIESGRAYELLEKMSAQ